MATKTWDGAVGSFDSGNWSPSPPTADDDALIRSGLVTFNDLTVFDVPLQLGGTNGQTPGVFMHDTVFGDGVTEPEPINGSATASAVIDGYAYWLGRNQVGDSFTGRGELTVNITTGSFFFTTGDTYVDAGSRLTINSNGGLFAQYGNLHVVGGMAVLNSWTYGPGRLTLESSRTQGDAQLALKSGVSGGTTVDFGDTNVSKAVQIDFPQYFLGSVTNFDSVRDTLLLRTGSDHFAYDGAGRLDIFAGSNQVASLEILGANGSPPLGLPNFQATSDGTYTQFTYRDAVPGNPGIGITTQVQPGSLHNFA